MKSTVVDESLSTTSTDVLFQRIPTNFKNANSLSVNECPHYVIDIGIIL